MPMERRGRFTPKRFLGTRHIEDSAIPEPNTGCWLWLGPLSVGGYGRWTNRAAHRRVYELLVGPIPEGKQLDRVCRVRCCVNPRHLEPVTCRENLMRGNTLQRANAAKTACLRGHPFDAQNTYRCHNGARACRACTASRMRAAREYERMERPK